MPVCNKQRIIPAITTSERSLRSRRADFLKLWSGISLLQPNISRPCSHVLTAHSSIGALSLAERKGSKNLVLHPELSIGAFRASPITSPLSARLDSQSWQRIFGRGDGLFC